MRELRRGLQFRTPLHWASRVRAWRRLLRRVRLRGSGQGLPSQLEVTQGVDHDHFERMPRPPAWVSPWDGVCWCVCVFIVGCLFLRTPSRAPYRTPSACASREATSGRDLSRRSTGCNSRWGTGWWWRQRRGCRNKCGNRWYSMCKRKRIECKTLHMHKVTANQWNSLGPMYPYYKTAEPQRSPSQRQPTTYFMYEGVKPAHEQTKQLHYHRIDDVLRASEAERSVLGVSTWHPQKF